VLVTVLLLPSVELIVVWVIDVHRIWVRDGRHVPLFSFAFIRGHVFGREEGADIRIVSGKELEPGQQVFCALEIGRRAAGAYEEDTSGSGSDWCAQTSDTMRRLTCGREVGENRVRKSRRARNRIR
jgi:hypothetical protein